MIYGLDSVHTISQFYRGNGLIFDVMPFIMAECLALSKAP